MTQVDVDEVEEDPGADVAPGHGVEDGDTDTGDIAGNDAGGEEA